MSLDLNSLRSSPRSQQRDELEWSSQPPTSGRIADMTDAHQQAQQTQQQQHAAPPATGFFATPFAAVGVEYGKTLMRSRTAEQLSAGLGGWLRQTRLRPYWQVSQPVLVRKLGKLLFPFIHHDWARRPLDESDSGLLAASVSEGASSSANYAPAKDDVNAPDMYLGTMAFFAFVVTMGFAQGSVNQFSPESLVLNATRSMVCLAFEVACVYGAFYLSDSPHSPAVLDLLCLTLCQFVALNLDVVLGVLLGPTCFYIVFIALALSTAVYVMRTLNGWLPANMGHMGGQPHRYRTMLAVSAALQLTFSLFLIYPALGAVHASRGLTSSGIAGLERAETSPGGMLDASHVPTPVITRPARPAGGARDQVNTRKEAPEEVEASMPESVLPPSTPPVEPVDSAPVPEPAAGEDPESDSAPATRAAPDENVRAASPEEEGDRPTPANPIRGRINRPRARATRPAAGADEATQP